MSVDSYTWSWDIINCWCYSPISLLLILPRTKRSVIALMLSKVCSSARTSSLNRRAFHTFCASSWLLNHPLLFGTRFFRYSILSWMCMDRTLPPDSWLGLRLKHFFLPAHFSSNVPRHLQPRIQSCRATMETVTLYEKELYIHVLSFALHSKSIWKIMHMLKWGPWFSTKTLSKLLIIRGAWYSTSNLKPQGGLHRHTVFIPGQLDVLKGISTPHFYSNMGIEVL
jgi:hypothetical protein